MKALSPEVDKLIVKVTCLHCSSLVHNVKEEKQLNECKWSNPISLDVFNEKKLAICRKFWTDWKVVPGDYGPLLAAKNSTEMLEWSNWILKKVSTESCHYYNILSIVQKINRNNIENSKNIQVKKEEVRFSLGVWLFKGF